MIILIDLTALADNFSGIERFALSVTNEMIKCTQNKYILLFKNRVYKDFIPISRNVKAVVINGKNKLIFNQIILPIVLLRYNADIYFFPSFPAPFFFFNKKSISTIHDVGCWDCPSSNKKHMTLYFKLLYWKASLCDKNIITVSEFSKERIIDILKVKADKILVAYNGLSDIFLKNKYSESENKKIIIKYKLPDHYILCLGTLEPRKNLKLLIKAYAELFGDREIDLELVLAGRKGWMMDDLLSNITKDIKSHIHITGFIDDEDLPYIYKDAELFIFPSLYEGFGIPPIEAMSMGTTVISSNAASMPEILGDSVSFFCNNDLLSLKKSIIKTVTASKEEQNRQKIRGIEKSKTYTWENSSRKILEYFKNINI